MKPQNEMLALYSSSIVAFVFFILWAFTNTNPTDLFIYFVLCYCVVVLVSLFIPIKKS